MTTRKLSVALLSVEQLAKLAPRAAAGTIEAQKLNHQVLLSAASIIVGDDEDARTKACEATLKFLNALGVTNKTARAARNWLTSNFRIGVEFDASGYKEIRFKPNSEKADDFAGADAKPYWVGEAKPAKDEAKAMTPKELREEFARFMKKMDAVNSDNATKATKTLARKARALVAEL